MTLLNLQEWVLGTLGTVLEKRFFELLGVLFRFSRKKVRHGNGLLQACKLRQLVLLTELLIAKVGLYPPSNLVIKVI